MVHYFGGGRIFDILRDGVWIGGGVPAVQNMHGKLVILFFWNYSSDICLRTLAYLEHVQEVYGKDHVIILSVHTPEFDFEKEEVFVQAALRRHGVHFPTLLDSEHRAWKFFACRVRPRVLIVNASGDMICDHSGEGGYALLALGIQEALTQMSKSNVPVSVPCEVIGEKMRYPMSGPRYFGFLRGNIANAHDALPEQEGAYTDRVTLSVVEDSVAHGHWKIFPEYLEHARNVSGNHEYVRFAYEAHGVDLVLFQGYGVVQARVSVLLNGQEIPRDMSGEDVQYDAEGAFIQVDGPRLYHVICSRTHHKGELHLGIAQKGVRLYKASFSGSCSR